MIFLKHCPDETLASLLVRQARVNGYPDCNDVFGAAWHRQRAISFVETEIDFPRFCGNTRNVYGSPAELIRRLTSLHALAHLGDIAPNELRAIRCGGRNLSLGQLTFFETTALSYCQSCLAEDIAVHGFSYWHRVHQLPFVQRCPCHDERLVRFSCKREHLHHSFPLPGDALIQANARGTQDDSLSGFWSDVAITAAKTLADESEPHQASTICDTIKDALRMRGLLTRTGRLHGDEFDASFGRFQPRCPSSCSEPLRKVLENPRLLLRGIIDSRKGQPFSRVVLIVWLFGEWETFKEQCKWRETLDRPLAMASGQRDASGGFQGSAISSEQAIGAAHRQICMDYLMGNSNPSRLEFLRTHYRNFHWLLHKDRSWLNAQLPFPERSSFQLGLFDD